MSLYISTHTDQCIAYTILTQAITSSSKSLGHQQQALVGPCPGNQSIISIHRKLPVVYMDGQDPPLFFFP